MRISRILITAWIACDCCLAAYSAGLCWTYRAAINATCIDVSNLCWRLWI